MADLRAPMLRFQAEILDDLERVRAANQNRLRQLTRSAEDSDGEVRGLGLAESDPAVVRMADLVHALYCGAKEPRRKKGCTPGDKPFFCLEHVAMIHLQDTLRLHLLHPWITAQKGIGDKQGARLLAAIGDPYWNDLHDRPRTVSELWAYCGYHTIKLPVGQGTTTSQGVCADRNSLPSSGQPGSDAPSTSAGAGGYNVAAKRTKGAKANWSATAKMRAYLIAESVVKSGGPWREVYDKRKGATEGRVHVVPCVRCGPSGKPAQPGSDWSAGHRHADALRITAKEILKGLWTEARRLHGEP